MEGGMGARVVWGRRLPWPVLQASRWSAHEVTECTQLFKTRLSKFHLTGDGLLIEDAKTLSKTQRRLSREKRRDTNRAEEGSGLVVFPELEEAEKTGRA